MNVKIQLIWHILQIKMRVFAMFMFNMFMFTMCKNISDLHCHTNIWVFLVLKIKNSYYRCFGHLKAILQLIFYLYMYRDWWLDTQFQLRLDVH